MPLDGVCLWSPAVPSWGLGLLWRTFHLLSWAKGQNVAIPGERPHKVTLQVLSFFPLDTGHMLSLGLQAIFRLSSFFFNVKVCFKHFLISCYILFLWLSQKAYKEKCFYESDHFHFTLHLHQTVWILQWNKFCGQCHFGIFHFGEGLHNSQYFHNCRFCSFFYIVFVIQRIFC